MSSNTFRAVFILFAGGLVALLAASQPATAQPLSTTPDFAVESNQASALMGNFVAPAGDVNGDGYADVFISTPKYDDPEIDEGRIDLYLGGPAGLASTPAWSFESDQADAQLRPASAGDIDGDGYDDAVVGAGLYDGPQVNTGRVWIFRGGPGGLETTPSWIIDGVQDTEVFGGSVAVVGDVNGDGYDDVLIGAAGYDGAQVDAGAAFLYYGSPTGPSATPDWMAEADQSQAQFGRVAAAGDVNGDGYADFLVGAQFYGAQWEGAAFLYLGSRNGPRKKVTMLTINEPNAVFGNNLGTAGDVNGDGFDDIVVSAEGINTPTFVQRVFVYEGRKSGVSHTPDLVLDSGQTNSNFGLSLGTAGDVNGDGFDDLIVGARLYDDTLTNQGRVFVYEGSASGLDPTPVQFFDGTQAYEEFGVHVATAGDVNGDGFSDVVIGAHGYSNPENAEGLAVVYHGGH